MKKISISSHHVKAALKPKSQQKKSKEKVQRERAGRKKERRKRKRGGEELKKESRTTIFPPAYSTCSAVANSALTNNPLRRPLPLLLTLMCVGVGVR